MIFTNLRRSFYTVHLHKLFRLMYSFFSQNDKSTSTFIWAQKQIMKNQNTVFFHRRKDTYKFKPPRDRNESSLK